MEPGYDVYEYSRKGNLGDLREALANGSKADEYMAYDGSTALVMSARSGHGKIVTELLAHGASTSVRTDDGSTMLHHAVSGGNVEVVKAILAARVSVNEVNEDGVTPLMLAAHYGAGDLIPALCDAGADLNCSVTGWGTALDGANGPAVDILESLGAKRSEDGADQPLAAAAERFHYGCFESGENPHSTPVTAPSPAQAPLISKKAKVGDSVQLRKPKSGLLTEGMVGKVIEDDGTDSLPLKVQVGEGYDYYNHHDVVVCSAEVDLPPDSDRATPEGTLRYVSSRLGTGVSPSSLCSTGLSISPVGFGCHRVDKDLNHEQALRMAIQLGCNFVDLAPNYTDGVAEQVVGGVLKEMIDSKKLRRDEIVVATKVGNVLGQQMQYAEGVPKMVQVNDNLCHCVSPEWIKQELTRSLERLHLKCVDCLLLHCPEVESKADDVDMTEVYARLKEAFEYLEQEVKAGRIAMYGISAAFVPLRPTDPEHLDLERVLAQLPKDHHFRVLQFPLNFAEANTYWVSHTPRNPDGTAVDRDHAMQAESLFKIAKKNGLATLINRPLDGIYKESHGVLRFSSLDCDVRSFSELQLDNCDVLEEKLDSLCSLGHAPYNISEGNGQLAGKTVKVLMSLENVDCVLVGLRRPEYVLGTLPITFATPRLPAEVAEKALRSVHNTIDMWFATAIHEADHGTSKTWRLPVDQKGALSSDKAATQKEAGA